MGTMASVRLMPRPRLLLSPTTDTVDMEATVVDTEAMVDTVTAGATMASVRPMPRLSLTTDMVDTEATVEDTEVTEATGATVVTMVATTASVRPRLSPTMAKAWARKSLCSECSKSSRYKARTGSRTPPSPPCGSRGPCSLRSPPHWSALYQDDTPGWVQV